MSEKMNVYEAKLKHIKELQHELSELLLNDATIEAYDKFEIVEDIYPVDEWIQRPFSALAERALKDVVLPDNMKYARVDYNYMEYAERHQTILFTTLIEGYKDELGMVVDPDMEREDFTPEEMDMPIIPLFTYGGVEYKFSFNELVNELSKYALETKTSGFTYDW